MNREEQKLRARLRSKEYYAKHREERLEKARAYREANPTHVPAEYYRERRWRLKEQAIRILGAKCSRCWHTDIRALIILPHPKNWEEVIKKRGAGYKLFCLNCAII